MRRRAASLGTPLADELKRLIAAEGPLPVDRYMALCLGHPRHGYYMRRDPLGRSGDFTTAPEISQMFGELIGIWCVAQWQAMGAPEAARVIELGPGRGTLMADLLRAARVMPGFLDAVAVDLIETSPALRAKQQQALSGSAVPVAWHDHLEAVPSGPALIVANEFFDALPVKQYVRAADGWRERLVGLGDDGRLTFGLAPAPTPQGLLPPWAETVGEGHIIEVAPARLDVARSIGRRLAAEGGAALVIDYGHIRSGPGDTLQAVRRHAFSNALDQPGECDLTSHVDFEALAAALHGAGAAVHGPITQGMFLTAMGLAERAEVLKRRTDMRGRLKIDGAAQRLAAGSQMGHLFKVIAAAHPDLPPPYPFAGPKP